MKKLILSLLILSISSFSQNQLISLNNNIEVNDKLIINNRYNYYDREIYIHNENSIIYQGLEKRIFIKNIDLKTFRSFEDRHSAYAIDKNGVYVEGVLTKVNTSGYKNLRRFGFWGNKKAIYFKDKKQKVSDPKSFEVVNYSYFKDKNHIYFFDSKVQMLKVVKEADVATFKISSWDAYDKNYRYKDSKIELYKKQKLNRVNFYLGKTKAHVVQINSSNFPEQKHIDHKTLVGISRSYAKDKNNVYYVTQKLPIKKQDLNNVKAWHVGNSDFVSDGKNVFKGTSKIIGIDSKTFGVIPDIELVYDKNGIYRVKWDNENAIAIKVQFDYTHFNNADTKRYRNFLVSGDYVYSFSDNKIQRLSEKEINLIKKFKFFMGEEIIKDYNYSVKKTKTKVICEGKETSVDLETFKKVNYYFYKDKNNVYSVDKNKLKIVSGIDSKSFKPLNIFTKDKNHVLFGLTKIIESKNVELLAIFAGYRRGCSQDENWASDFYLFKNYKGYWLFKKSGKYEIRFLGKKMLNQKEWHPRLKEKFKLNP